MMGEREKEREKVFRALDDRGSIFPVLWALIDRTVVRKGRYENVNCFQGNSPHLRSHTQHRRARLYTFTYIITHQFANVGPRMREKGSSHFLTSQIGWPTKKKWQVQTTDLRISLSVSSEQTHLALPDVLRHHSHLWFSRSPTFRECINNCRATTGFGCWS